MGRWLVRGVAIAGIGGVVALGGGSAAFAQGGAAATTQPDPLSSLTKQLQGGTAALPTLPLDPAQLTKLLENGAKSLSALKLPDLGGLVPKTPLVCGIGLGIANSTPVNGLCPGSKVVTVTKTVPKTKTRTVTKVVHEPTKTKVVAVPVNYQQPVAAAPTGKLAYTGFETTPVLAAGVAALIGGTVLTACARPRRRRG